MVDTSGINIATTNLPGKFTWSHDWVGLDTASNQLEGAEEYSVGSSQDSRSAVSYPTLSLGLVVSPTDDEILANTLGLGVDMPTGVPIAGRASDGVQVSIFLLASVTCRDRLAIIGNALGPIPIQQCLRPLSTGRKPHQRFVWDDQCCGDWRTSDEYHKV